MQVWTRKYEGEEGVKYFRMYAGVEFQVRDIKGNSKVPSKNYCTRPNEGPKVRIESCREREQTCQNAQQNVKMKEKG